jgi:creatinine amidohydrolase
VTATNRKAPSAREMERINWIEFREWVPAKIRTVLLPLGTLEPHGVAPNGTDILASVAMAHEIAPRVNALVAPAIPYGFTGVLDAYPGSFTIPEAAFRDYVHAVLAGLAKNQFKNIILLYGHGGGQTAVLSALAQEVGRETGTRILVVNWWSYCSDVTLEVFGEHGGHGAENETAYIMAIDPALIQKKHYNPEMATALPPAEHVERISLPVDNHALQGRPGLSEIRSGKSEDLFHEGERQDLGSDSKNDQEMGHGGSVRGSGCWAGYLHSCSHGIHARRWL